MIITEWVMLGVAFVLGLWTSWTDLQTGFIRNKDLLVFAVIGIVLNLIYYCVFVPDLFIRFAINLAAVAAVSLGLFYTSSFAGGDAKLAIVFALLYPAGCLFQYGGHSCTLFVALAFGAIYGYLYLFADSIKNLIQKKNKLSVQDLTGRMLQAIKRYFIIASYVGLLNMILLLTVPQVFAQFGSYLNILIFLFAFAVGKYRIFQNIWLLSIVLTVDLLGYILLGLFPFSLNPYSYLYILAFIGCQSVINLNLYENVRIEDLKPGMIPSTAFSMLYQKSRFKNIPSLSKENLKSRLNADEVSAISRWAAKVKMSDITIVKKIPFAVFLFLGYLTYFLIWRILI